jgi:hypothetical protein
VARYRGKVTRLYFRADAGFANPEVYEFLEAEGINMRSVCPPTASCRNGPDICSNALLAARRMTCAGPIASFTYQAGSWSRPRRVIAKVEWHPGELYPRVGFIITNMSRPAKNVVAFYNKRGTCEQWIKARSNGHGCHVGRSPPTRFVFSFMHSLTISATFCARWLRPSRSKTGR